LVRAGIQNSSFAQGSADLLDYLDFQVDPKQVERVTERIGAERCVQRDAAVAHYQSLPLTERKNKPAGVTAPDLAVVCADGGRLQMRAEVTTAAPAVPAKTTASAAATLTPSQTAAADVEEVLPPDDQHRGQHWREDKIGLLMTMTSVEQAADPCPKVPETFVNPTRITKLARELKTKKSAQVTSPGSEVAGKVEDPEQIEQVLRADGQAVGWEPPEMQQKTLLATRRPWANLGPLLAQEAWQQGFFQAERQAFVGDGSDHVWSVWRLHFSSFTPILDIIHVISYLFASATAGRPFAEGWCCYARWMTWTWRGEVTKVIAELAQRQADLGCATDEAGCTDPRVLVSTALPDTCVGILRVEDVYGPACAGEHGAGLPANTSGQNELRGVSPPRPAGHVELCGVSGETVQPPSQRHGEILDGSRRGSGAATARRLPGEHHDGARHLLAESAREGDGAKLLHDGRVKTNRVVHPRRRRKAWGRSPCRARLRRRCNSGPLGRVASRASWAAVSEGASRKDAQAAASEVMRLAA
jgi:hypothetical protein